MSDLLDFAEDIQVMEAFEEAHEEKARLEADKKRKQQEALKNGSR